MVGTRPEAAVAGGVDAARAAAWLAKQVELGLASVELSLPQYRVLGVLAEGVAIPSALADRLTVRRPTVTAVVDGLEARGLVERRPGGTTDRRSVPHTLTTKGRRLLAKADAAVGARLSEIAAALEDPALADQALCSLELWRRAMRAYHGARVAAT
jgi:long-chain acyl-CoA synthetase